MIAGTKKKAARGGGKGRRSSAARAFLESAKKRPNLVIQTEALVDRILFEGRRCTGVRYKHGDAWVVAKCRRETILSCGAFQSPQVLLRSGIGHRTNCQSMGSTC
ncbi:GMC family oxidoreductase N-terminal domain-containing protein [Tropicibacter sp. Alg240-R139]|uniref:GMC family oxidoreductase N-terminal domain-containing protein n=1 Tax=Tropicibacter sp. Alg240-R139 TaxID=2305991 RepID=UPI0035943C26